VIRTSLGLGEFGGGRDSSADIFAAALPPAVSAAIGRAAE